MKKVTFGLSQREMKKAISDIEGYKKFVVVRREQLEIKLASVGLEVALAHVAGYDISFDIRTNSSGTLLVGWSERQLREWYNPVEGDSTGMVKSYDYSPILMAEFGSGKFAIEPDISGVVAGRGTYPNSVGRDSYGLRDAWAYRKTSSQTKPTVSHGEIPTRPMMKADQEIIDKLIDVAQEVFSK